MITVDVLPDEGEAVDVLERALRDGLDPEADLARTVAEVPAGQILLMPGAVPGYAGVKVATVAPGGHPRIKGVYVLLDGATLAPVALLDGIALTAVRTPGVSALAVRHLAVPDARRLVVFGTGPQAWGHVHAVRAVRPGIEQVAVVGRGGAEAFAERCRGLGLAAAVAPPEAVADADVIACCTTAREPLFPGRLVPEHATVVAVGSHEPDAREVDGDLAARATVVVESRAAALREAGDLIIPGVTPDGNLADLLAGRVRPDGPRLFKSVGMAWEDLAVAVAAYERSGR